MANATSTVTFSVSTSTVTQSTTVTFTGTHTVTTTLPAPGVIAGIPVELWILIIPGIILCIWWGFRLSVKTTPVRVEWLAKNYSALELRASEDLQGLWLTIINAKGKKVETIKKTGRAVEVYDLDNKGGIAYTFNEKKKAAGLQPEDITMLEGRGFKIEEVKKGDKRKGYLIKKDSPETELVYLDVPEGGMRHKKLYTAVEGTGHTLDLLNPRKLIDEAEAQEEDSSAALIHEEINAAKSWLQILADAAKGTLGNTLILLACGGAIGGLIVTLLFLFTGHG